MKFLTKFLGFMSLGFALVFANTLKVGTSPNYPPFEFIDNNNKISGFDIDLLDEISKRTGFKYELVSIGFDALIPALKSGKIDIAASAMSATPQRMKAIDFTKSYFFTENLYIKRANDASLKTKDDLKGKKLSAQLGTVQEMAANETTAKVVAMEDVAASIMALKANKVDAVVVDSLVGYGYLKNNPDLVEFFKENDGSEGFSMAFDKNKHKELIEKFNKAIDEIKADDTFDKLLTKYELK